MVGITCFLKPWPIAVATASCILLMVTFGVLRNRPQPVVGTRPVPHTARLSAPTSAVASLIEKPPILLPPEAVLVWRSGENGDQAKWRDLQEALAPYQTGDYATAAQRLRRVASRRPGLAEAWFYLGVCELMVNDDVRAAADLETARKLSEPRLQDYPSWYLALAYQRLKSLRRVRVRFWGRDLSRNRKSPRGGLLEMKAANQR